MKRYLKAAVVAVIVTSLAACTSSRVQYMNPNQVANTTLNFGPHELQSAAETFVKSLLVFPPMVQYIKKNGRPIVFVDSIKNETDQHMDLTGINNTITTKLLNSGQYRFVDMSVAKNVKKQLSYQRDSGLVNNNTRIKFGQQLGAQYMLYGNVSTITSRTSDATDVYYLFTMKLLNLKTGIVEWADQKQFRKIKSRSTFGW